MAVAPAIDLTAGQRRTVLALLNRYLPNTTVWAYGSRVKWTSHPASDLDLVVFAEPEQASRVAELREAFDESNLLFRVDLFVWNDVPEDFRKRIVGEHVVLASGQQHLCKEQQKVHGTGGHIAGWRAIPIGDLAEVVGGGTPSTKDPDNFDGDIAWLTPKDLAGVQDRFVARGARNISRLGLQRSSAKLVPAGSVLLSTRAPVGYVALAKNSIATNQGFRSLIPSAGVVPEFLYYWLLINTPELERHATGSTFKELSGRELAKITLPLPPKSDQRKIVAVLGALDDKIELNRRMAETLDEVVRALFRSWFIDFDPVRAGTDAWTHAVHGVPWVFPDEIAGSELGAIPKGWRVAPLADCFNLTMGQSPPGWTYNENGEGLPFFQGSKDFGFRYPTNRKFCVQPNRVAEPGDTLVSVRAPVGDVNLAFERCCIGRGVASLRHKSGAASYTYHYMSSMRLKLQRYENEGTVFGSLNRHQFEQLRVVEPCRKVIDLFESYSRPLDELVSVNWLECQTLMVMRDTLLPKLLSGEVRIPDAEKITEAAT